jgi:Fe-S oxidoreductase
MRVALMTGCAQRALNTDINDATIRLLTRLGCEVVIAEGQGCCGALTHHMGKTEESHATAAKNIRAWHREMDGRGARCHRDQHLGLRHDGEGLRPHVPQRNAGGGGEGA